MSLAIRPSWSVELACPSREVIVRLADELAAGAMHFKRSRVPGGGDAGLRETDFFVLTVPPSQRRFWSPWLSIDVAPDGAGARVHAQFSPHPSVWTGVWFGYLALGLIFTVALVIAGSGTLVPGAGQPWALWLAGGAALAMAGLWTGAQVGQRLARGEMEALRAELERALGACR